MKRNQVILLITLILSGATLIHIINSKSAAGLLKSKDASVERIVDNYFQKWIKAWKELDYSTLKTFGSEDEMSVYNYHAMMNNMKNNILLYKDFKLHKVTPATFSELDRFYVMGSPVNITTFFVAQKSSEEYNIAQIWFSYDKDEKIIKLSSYNLYSEETEPMPGLPVEYKPKAFSSTEQAKQQIDKLVQKTEANYPKK